MDWGTMTIAWEGVPVGVCRFHGPPEAGVVEIGYAIDAPFRGRGLASAAARLLVARAFADPRVDAVVAHTPAAPGPSPRILERLGFACVRELRDERGPVWQWKLLRHVARDGVAGP
jgi:RimJ/RimL family protein N-acetyltransferase